MIKTDQNADYYEGAMDCIDQIVDEMNPATSGPFLFTLKATVKKLWEDYYARMEADCNPFNKVSLCSICTQPYPLYTLGLLRGSNQRDEYVCVFCAAKSMHGWQEGQPCPFRDEMKRCQWEDAMRFRKSREVET